MNKRLINSGKHVVSGEIVEGMDIVKQLEKLGSREGRVSTSRKSLIRDCGLVSVDEKERDSQDNKDKVEGAKAEKEKAE